MKRLEGRRVGCAMTGSFCTLAQALTMWEALSEEGCEMFPILSETVANTDTRFFPAKTVRERMVEICRRPLIENIVQAEPIGPKKLLDLLIVAPCTGNTLGKLAGGITDSSVTMAVKAQLRNSRPVLLAVSTNDGLAASARSIGTLMSARNIFFVPYSQDDPSGKPTSLVADFSKAIEAACLALSGRQMQPVVTNDCGSAART